MNRRSFLSIIGVGIACPLALLKAEPPDLTREQLLEAFRKAFKATKFISPAQYERRGSGERRYIIIWDEFAEKYPGAGIKEKNYEHN